MKVSYTSLLLMPSAFLWILTIESTCAQGKNAPHYLYHSVFIYNFCKYIQWPDENQTHIIGVLGESPILQGLYRMARAKSSPTMRFIVHKYQDINDIEPNCHILFIPNSFPLNHIRKQNLLQKVNQIPILLITEKEDYIQDFSGINFIVRGDKLLFQLNPTNVGKVGLKVSPQLLRVAIIVQQK